MPGTHSHDPQEGTNGAFVYQLREAKILSNDLLVARYALQMEKMSSNTDEHVQKKHGLYCRLFNSRSGKGDDKIDEDQVMEEEKEPVSEETKAPSNPLAEEYAEKKHGLYCHIFNKNYEQREVKRAERQLKYEAKEQARRERQAKKYGSITMEQLDALQKRSDEHKERQEHLFPTDNSAPKVEKKKPKKLHEYISAGTKLRY